MATGFSLSLQQLKRAIQVHEDIERLQTELSALLGQSGGKKRGRKPGSKAASGADGAAVGNDKVKRKKKVKRVMSPEAREKIAAAQRKRWAKQKKAGKKADSQES